MKSSKFLVTKDMKLQELVEKYPESANIMFSYGLHCVGCHVSSFETIEDGAKAHGMSDEDINRLVKEINETINKPNKKEEIGKEEELETREDRSKNQSIAEESKEEEEGNFLGKFFRKLFR